MKIQAREVKEFEADIQGHIFLRFALFPESLTYLLIDHAHVGYPVRGTFTQQTHHTKQFD